MTVDGGARVSARWARGFFEPFVGAVVALSVATTTPAGAIRDDEHDRRFLPTAFRGDVARR